ncbi:MAG: hypothetical protein NC937_04895 [Candidatus Omnitrophica bacterium]|nr:hypothetical protein [Candidatus Omnitrophota bacterium]MCM8825460.1 hypothetical protein [Candidatus Omnitrophota bacterium]
MANVRFALAVVRGRDGINHAGLCMIIDSEKWFAFNDALGICFRRTTETGSEDIPADEMKKNYAGIYRMLAGKWTQITAVLKGEDSKAGSQL